MRKFSFLAILVFGARLHAAPAAIQIPGGASTKLDRELVLTSAPATPDIPDAMRVTIRRLRSHKTIASDTFEAFRVVTEVDPRTRAAWSPTGEYVALNLQGTRHTTDTLIYRLTKALLTRIEMPFYWSEAQKVLGAGADFRGGIETPLRWLDRHTLVVRSQGDLRDDTEFDLLLTIRFAGTKVAVQSVTLNRP